MPGVMVLVALAPILVMGCAGLLGVSPLTICPVTAAAAAEPADAAGADSWSVPHEPHSGQRPSHLGEKKQPGRYQDAAPANDRTAQGSSAQQSSPPQLF